MPGRLGCRLAFGLLAATLFGHVFLGRGGDDVDHEHLRVAADQRYAGRQRDLAGGSGTLLGGPDRSR